MQTSGHILLLERREPCWYYQLLNRRRSGEAVQVLLIVDDTSLKIKIRHNGTDTWSYPSSPAPRATLTLPVSGSPACWRSLINLLIVDDTDNKDQDKAQPHRQPVISFFSSAENHAGITSYWLAGVLVKLSKFC